MVARFASYFGRAQEVFFVGKYFVVRFPTTKTTKILPPEKISAIRYDPQALLVSPQGGCRMLTRCFLITLGQQSRGGGHCYNNTASTWEAFLCPATVVLSKKHLVNILHSSVSEQLYYRHFTRPSLSA